MTSPTDRQPNFESEWSQLAIEARARQREIMLRVVGLKAMEMPWDFAPDMIAYYPGTIKNGMSTMESLVLQGYLVHDSDNPKVVWPTKAGTDWLEEQLLGGE
ncbi:MAG TPA: hypothetical protein VGF75_06390 [Candidatus Saccharimonadales bacterium]|jgi:hypothetical protein